MEQCHNEIEVGWVASPLPNSPSTTTKGSLKSLFTLSLTLDPFRFKSKTG
ncbi:hypothetical protein HanXRQr2_Chr03g0120491 [Helianthus annuus]|uniref:Uncharacterized protein n=1 Tax=Helianthus annuus TaxID=4232 RepID=A0A9K3JHS2_HELAN|nr:hypothetical protein HanXRQr2_Chr03g0120491 [Helianthus annuus]